MLFLIIPILLIVLYGQFGAENRLIKIGFKPHPSFSGSVGVATGTGKNPIWVFSTTAETSSILQFYKDPSNHDSWSIKTENTNGLVFEKGSKNISILISNGNVVFSLIKNEGI
ncbi:MAG: hypothetical protein COA95_01245 [Methylophaga sp.]|nr:MAG: hypothetical protein COA95_01245 [Methylophaga sp.]